MSEQFTKYERARILGARALQISMDAPVLLKLDEKKLEELNYDSLRIAEAELDEGVLPISINRPLPERKEAKLKVIKSPESVASTENPSEEKVAVVEEDDLSQELGENFESEGEVEESSVGEE